MDHGHGCGSFYSLINGNTAPLSVPTELAPKGAFSIWHGGRMPQQREPRMSKTNTSITMNDDILLLQSGYMSVPVDRHEDAKPEGSRLQGLGTVLSNLEYYGYVPSADATAALLRLDEAGIETFWNGIQPALAYVTGEDRKMGDHVVYKNFPREVLEMPQATYWLKQVLMYWGMPSDWFVEESEPRAEMTEARRTKVLDLATSSTFREVWARLCRVNAGWTDFQKAQAEHLLARVQDPLIDMAEFSFKENGVLLVASRFAEVLGGARPVAFSTATDVLRLAAALSDGDISLRKKTKFRKFSRPERRFLVGLIDGARHIEQDFAMRKEQWKRLLSFLHPSEFGFEKVNGAYDLLYRGLAKTPSARVEALLAARDVSVLEVLSAQPGAFLRRLHQAYDLFGSSAFEAFKRVTEGLTVSQLLKIDGYLATVNDRKAFIVAPRGNWENAQIVENGKKKIEETDLLDLRLHLSSKIGSRIDGLHPEGFGVSPLSSAVKLQSNGQELASYGRGTVFDIPEAMKFVRTASYWKAKREFQNVWFDVGWNFFDADWNALGTVCWNSTHPFPSGSAVFSGDPTNIGEIEGRACQMIDLYPDMLAQDGVRYAVWSVLCYSNIPFSDAEEVLATLQWGEEPQQGGLYEPSRAQNVFPLTGKSKSKYVAYLDLAERKLVYLDLALRSNVSSADNNAEKVGEAMPSVLEHLAAIPSVYDVFGHATPGAIPVRYHDEGEAINGPAYVFERRNADNDIAQVDVEAILNSKGV